MKRRCPPRIDRATCRCSRCEDRRREAQPSASRPAKKLEPFQPVNAQQTSLFAIVLVVGLMAITACAGVQVRRDCRAQCQDKRGPVLTWFGGPTVPPAAWDECMAECTARADDG